MFLTLCYQDIAIIMLSKMSPGNRDHLKSSNLSADNFNLHIVKEVSFHINRLYKYNVNVLFIKHNRNVLPERTTFYMYSDSM